MNTGKAAQDNLSQERLRTVDVKLQALFEEVAQGETKFIVTEGIRTKDRQIELVAHGASKTLNSKHLTGQAVDVAILINGQLTWAWPAYVQFAAYVKQCAQMRDIPIVWGGDWPTFKDGPHYELA